MRNRNPKNDWFFDNFEHDDLPFKKKTIAKFGAVWFLMILVNLLFWAILIILGAWAVGHFIL